MSATDLTELIDPEAIQRKFTTLPLKDAVHDLERYDRGQVRAFLEQSGLTSNLPRLREVVEASLMFVGGEEHSSLVAALEPQEIAHIVPLSPEIFSGDNFHLIRAGDLSDRSRWDIITREHYERIVASGDQKLIARLANFHSEPWTAKGKAEGPWAMFREDIEIFADAVLSYFSAICNADRPSEWKEEAIRAIGLDLLSVAERSFPEIYWRCLREYPSIADALRARREKPEVIHDAAESHREAIAQLRADLGAADVDLGGQDLGAILDDLRAVGIEHPTVDEVRMTIETNREMEAFVTQGADSDDEE